MGACPSRQPTPQQSASTASSSSSTGFTANDIHLLRQRNATIRGLLTLANLQPVRLRRRLYSKKRLLRIFQQSVGKVIDILRYRTYWAYLGQRLHELAANCPDLFGHVERKKQYLDYKDSATRARAEKTHPAYPQFRPKSRNPKPWRRI